MSLVEQELLTLPAHLSLPPALSGVRVAQSLVLEQTTQWPKEKDKQRSTKHIYKTKNRVTRNPQKNGFSRRACSSCSTSGTRRVKS